VAAICDLSGLLVAALFLKSTAKNADAAFFVFTF
jgi:hypothetical protein